MTKASAFDDDDDEAMTIREGREERKSDVRLKSAMDERVERGEFI